MDMGRFTGGFGETGPLAALEFAAKFKLLLPQSHEGWQRRVFANAAHT